jgi:hypothetical protein
MPADSPGTSPAVVVSATLSVTSMLTALTALFRAARWAGVMEARGDALTAALEQSRRDQTARLDEIREDVREIRAIILSSHNYPDRRKPA